MTVRSGPKCSWGLAALAACIPAGAMAGMPFLTDDPDPTPTRHWEIYAPVLEADGRDAEFDGAASVEVNYGAAKGLQLTLGLPLAYTHDSAGWQWGVGDVEVAAKYQILNDEHAGFSVALFPAVSLPTASHGLGNGRVTALLPIWAQKDVGPWSIFGGGGYTINPGDGNRDYWTASIAITRQLSQRLLLGIEANHEGQTAFDGSSSTRLGLGAIYQLKAPFRLLVSGGPTFTGKGETPGFHAFLGLGFDL